MKEIFTLKVTDLSLHKEALATPKMSTDQYEALKADIDVRGQLDPVVVYRAQIVDGRHRWLILQELGITDISVVKMAHKSTIKEIKAVVRSKELRRHETASQLAITAYRLTLDMDDQLTQAEAAAKVGANTKRIGEAKKIATIYGRPDILELLFDGGKFNTGTSHIPFYTDSLGTIIRWLGEHGVIAGATDKDIGVKAREEMTEDEQVLVNKFIAALTSENKLVKQAVCNTLYAELKE